MRQIPADELAHIIRFELSRLGKMTLRDMASGHQDTKRRAVKLASSYLLHRMRDWEIIVPDGLGAPIDRSTQAGLRVQGFSTASDETDRNLPGEPTEL